MGEVKVVRKCLAPLSHACAAVILAACAAAPCVDVEGPVPTRDGRLFMRSAGRGPDVVLLHGLGDSSLTWYRLEDELRAAGLRVHVLDTLGAGRSDKPREGPYDIPSHVRRLESVLEVRGVESCVLIGNSLGGSQALLFALDRPERVRAMVLISPAAWAEGGWTGMLWHFPDAIDKAMTLMPPQLVARIALLVNFGNPLLITQDLIARYAQEVVREGTISAFVSQQQQVMPSPDESLAWTSRYPSLRVPTLILWGTRDRILPSDMGEQLAGVLPDARLVPLPGVGHAAQLEAPDQVLDATLGFLREQGILPSGR